MLISVKVQKTIEQEIKAEESYLKALENQEKNYKVDLTSNKEEAQASIDFYKKILKDAE